MNAFPFTIDKTKLPKERAYILKSSLLADALKEANIECSLNLHYWTPIGDGSILQAFYWMPTPRFSYRRVYVRAGSLLNQQRHPAMELLQQQALPQFIDWLKFLMALPDSSPLLFQEPFYDAVYVDGVLQIYTSPKPK